MWHGCRPRIRPEVFPHNATLLPPGSQHTGSEFRCALCTAEHVEILHDRARLGETLNTAACLSCGFVYTVPRPSREELAALYSQGEFNREARTAEGFDTRHFEIGYKSAISRIQQIASYEQSARPGGRLLDIGCGMGTFLRVARSYGFAAEGLEPDAALAAELERVLKVKVHGVLLEEAVLEQGAYDLVTSFHVIEHVQDPVAFLRQLGALIKPDGSIWIECPSLELCHTGDLDSFLWAPHINTFSERSLRLAFRQAGLEVVASGATATKFVWALGRLPADGKALPDPSSLYTSIAEVRTLIRPWRRKSQLKRAMNNPLGRGLAFLLRGAKRLLSGLKHPKALAEQIHRSWYRRTQGGALPDSTAIFLPGPSSRPQRQLVHYGAHHFRNAGDIILLEAVRRVFDLVEGPQQYSLRSIHQEVTARDIAWLNTGEKAVLLGGGGLILPDTESNRHSGWQWNCPYERLQELRAPLIVFAIGYNLFREQERLGPNFDRHIRLTVEKSVFFGLRNERSIAKLKQHLPEELHSRLVFQPCVTTILSRLLRPEYLYHPQPGARRRLALNVAFDREFQRFPGDLYGPLWRLARFARSAQQMGWEIDLVSHVANDRAFIPALLGAGVPFREVQLEGASTQRVVEYYSGVNLVLGMRGHAQMVPFGVGTPIFSLISHDKMAAFLSDIEHPEWGLELTDPDLEERLSVMLAGFTHQIEQQQRQEIARIQEGLFAISKANVERIFRELGGR